MEDEEIIERLKDLGVRVRPDEETLDKARDAFQQSLKETLDGQVITETITANTSGLKSALDGWTSGGLDAKDLKVQWQDLVDKAYASRYAPNTSEINAGTDLTKWVTKVEPTKTAPAFSSRWWGENERWTTYTPKGRKVITDFTYDVSYPMVETTSYTDPFRTYGQSQMPVRVWRDQDGDPMESELIQRLDAALDASLYATQEELHHRLRRVLEVWNNDDRPTTADGKPVTKPTGHKRKCLYSGTHDYPCTCQPSTLWSDSPQWHCDCCSQPRADIKYGLCDLCSAHQYAHGHQAAVEHVARDESEQ